MTVIVSNDVFVGCFTQTGGCVSISDSLANVWTVVTSNSNGIVWRSDITIGGSDLINIASPSAFSGVVGVQYNGLVAVGNVNQAAGTVATPVTVQSSLTTVSNDATFEAFGFIDTGGPGCDTSTAQNGQSKITDACVAVSSLGMYISGWNSITSGINSYGINVSGLGGANIQYSHFLVELQGSAPTQVTQCYGNCGSPPITLANTNSTKGYNFTLNQVSLLYIFQSSINGVIDNVTVPLGTIANNVQLGLYTACTSGSQPFTNSCPGFLQSTTNFGAQPKSRVTMTTSITVETGEWIGIAVAASTGTLIINDTNTQIQLYQFTGTMSSPVTVTTAQGNSKMGLWAYIRGINSIQPPPIGGCGQTVTCGLRAFWNAMGGDVAAGIGVFLVLFFLFFGIIFAISRGSGGGFPIGPMLLLMVIMSISLMVMLSAVGVLPAYLPILIIIVAAWMFTTKVLWSRHSEAGTAV
ncbi:hypothetical protein AUG19_02270 [archaeon 13_1_20CM_2_54_9]|nr:MAG: hypothetical protein AUJ07_03920 [Crenarchaeota archaeon 13_1_40CM_3_53_5]OLE76672.1 MAG: hypothetical protein AUG19_02270 [archaeon 13_1_20CM_2_54_9]